MPVSSAVARAVSLARLVPRAMPLAAPLRGSMCGRAPWQAGRSSLVSIGLRGFHTCRPHHKIVSFLLTDIGEGISEVQILQWHVKEGDKINAFDKVCEVASDKATVEISSRFSGTVTRLHYEVSAMAKVGDPLIDLEDGLAAEGAPLAAPAAPSAPVPETPPATAPPATSAAAPPPPPAAPAPPSPGVDSKVLTTPAVRALAKEHRIDLTQVRATGRDGRILKEDILAYLKAQAAPAPAPAPAAPAVAPASPGQPEGLPVKETVAAMPGDRTEPLSAVRRAMVKSMTQSLSIPTFSCGDSLEADALIALRQRCKALLQERAKAEGRPAPPLSFMPFIIKACSAALKRFPILNATLNVDEMEVVYRGRHNICVAMDTPGGLVVPNVKDVQSKSIVEIARELATLQELAGAGKLSPEHFQDGTFTLSNVGTIGSTWAIPVVFPPQVAIGAISKMEKVPRFDETGAVVSRHVMTFGWSADHRVVDGATMVRFSNLLMAYLRDSEQLLLDL